MTPQLEFAIIVTIVVVIVISVMALGEYVADQRLELSAPMM